jgi:hypothetical protein
LKGFTTLSERASSLFPGELRLLLLLARPELDPQTRARAREMISAGIAWPELVRLARRHRLHPLVADHLLRFPDVVPEPVFEQVARARQSEILRILERLNRLGQILSAMEKDDILAVPYKGPALSAQLYGSVTLRAPGDLDILVRRADVVRARGALHSLGYRASHPLDAAGIEFMIHNRYHEPFLHEDRSIVELHWAFANRDSPFAIDLDSLEARLGLLSVGGQPMPVFHPEDLLLILSVHGAKHRWDRLEWIAGLAQVPRVDGAIDWEGVTARAHRLGVHRAVSLGLLLASELLDAPLPAEVLAPARRDPRVVRLGEEVLQLLNRQPETWAAHETLRRDRFRTQIRERWRDRVRFAWHRLTTPSDPELWEIKRIGHRAVSLHALRRPFRLFGRLFAAVRAFVSGVARR